MRHAFSGVSSRGTKGTEAVPSGCWSQLGCSSRTHLLSLTRLLLAFPISRLRLLGMFACISLVIDILTVAVYHGSQSLINSTLTSLCLLSRRRSHKQDKQPSRGIGQTHPLIIFVTCQTASWRSATKSRHDEVAFRPPPSTPSTSAFSALAHFPATSEDDLMLVCS
ncbi:hypothetical protein GE09DRAFT_1141684 [Coniochaeta sp. 2T2.1]|nr:hypothetical protein GE09DRAFT_1141684 [Coniochaeta sp. 2T2.1]